MHHRYLDLVVGNRSIPVLEELNERATSILKVQKAVNEMKSSKAPGLDRIPVECVKKVCMTVLECSVRLLKAFHNMGPISKVLI